MKRYVPVLVAMLFLLQAGFCFSASSVMILANKASTPGAMNVRSAAVKAAVQRIASYFMDKGIGVFDEQAMDNVYGEIEQAGRIDIDVPDSDLIALALKKHAEVLVKLEIFSIECGSRDQSVSARAIAKMFDVSSGRLFAMSEQYDTNILPNPKAYNSALIAAASKAGARVGKRLYSKLEKNHPRILASLARSNIPEYVMVFSGFSEFENDTIIELVYDDLGLEEKNILEKKVTPGYVELEIFTEQRFGKFNRKLKKLLKLKAIPVFEKFRDSSKVIYIKEGTDIGTDNIRIHD